MPSDIKPALQCANSCEVSLCCLLSPASTPLRTLSQLSGVADSNWGTVTVAATEHRYCGDSGLSLGRTICTTQITRFRICSPAAETIMDVKAAAYAPWNKQRRVVKTRATEISTLSLLLRPVAALPLTIRSRCLILLLTVEKALPQWVCKTAERSCLSGFVKTADNPAIKGTKTARGDMRLLFVFGR